MGSGSTIRRALAWVGALAIAVGVIAPISLAGSAQPAAALSGSDWDASYIIGDTQFYDGTAMSGADIQRFLESKVGSCGNANCLRNVIVGPPSYGAVTSTTTGNLICSAVTGGAMPVSEWIYRVQVACGISAKVILVTLEKEQGLITGRSPSDRALLAAMGMGCPDHGTCNTAYAGLATQIYTGTKQLKTYRAARFGRQPGSQWIGFSPNSTPNAAPNPATGECGGTIVGVRNYATAALYNFTPYQPNAGALANLSGSAGGNCGAYGNRNFWRFYWAWFGDPRGGDPAFVEAVFQDLLGHTSGSAKSTPQNAALVAGWSRAAVAESIFTSDEYRLRGITQTYQRILGRAPDYPALDFWYRRTIPGTGLVSQVGGYLLTSDEMYVRAGNTPEGWVALVYESVLGRAPDPNGLAAWGDLVRSSGRAAVYSSIYNSPESVSRRVNLLYGTYLGRGADSAAIAYFTPTIQGGGDEAVATQLLGSTEYAIRASVRFPDGTPAGVLNPPQNQSPPPIADSAAVATSDPPFLSALAADLLGAPASPAITASWSSSLAGGLSRTWLATNTYQSAAYRSRTIGSAYQNVLGRAADSGGLAYWLGETAPSGSTLPSKVANALLASDEYVQHVGGTTPGWVAGVSQTLLGRAPTPAESSSWAGIAASSGRAAMITAIYTSPESVARRLASITQLVMGRVPTAAESSQFGVSVNVRGDEYVGAQLVGSPAYDARAQTRFPSAFLRSVGTDLLAADPLAGYVANWSRMIASGTTHYALASVIYGSTEHRTIEIRSAYQSMLGRDADAPGLNYWLAKTGDGTVRASTMREQFLLSDELYIRAGNTPEGWVSSLFRTVLGRTPDASGLAYWSAQVRAQGRPAVMWGIYDSPESAIQRLNSQTVKMLGRPATNADIVGLGPLMVSGGEEAVGAAIIGGREYDQHASTRF